MAFTHVQGQSVAGTVTSNSVVLGAAPTAGNLVCVAVCPGAAITALTVKDSNNNSYTISSGSPSTNQSGAGQVWLAYLLIAPANASATITASWSGGGTSAIWADEFSYTGTASFDKDAKANTGSASTTISTPSITATGSGELLYAAASAGGTISHPVAGATLGIWTGAGGAIRNGDMAEYLLSSSGSAQAVQFTQSSGGWSAMSMAIKAVSATSTDPPFLISQPTSHYRPDIVTV